MYPRAQREGLKLPMAADIIVAMSKKGPPVPQKNSIMFVQLLQLDLYREILRAGGDKAIEGREWKREHPTQNLVVQIAPSATRLMTFRYSILALQQMLYHMLTPAIPPFGFFAALWVVVRKTSGGAGRLPLAAIDFQLIRSSQVKW